MVQMTQEDGPGLQPLLSESNELSRSLDGGIPPDMRTGAGPPERPGLGTDIGGRGLGGAPPDERHRYSTTRPVLVATALVQAPAQEGETARAIQVPHKGGEPDWTGALEVPPWDGAHDRL